MRKRIFQICVLVVMLGTMALAANVLQAIAMAENRLEAVWAAQELEAKERAAEAWAELEAGAPELHMGCDSTVVDVIDMGLEVGIELGPLLEKLLKPEITLNAGTLYTQEDWNIGAAKYNMGMGDETADPFLVCVDAGHLGYTREGWKNTGAQSVSGEIEHTWSFKVAQALRDELLARGYNVYMVRDTDEWKEYPYDLGQRTTFTNCMKCDIMVAIHWDGYSDHAVDGYHTIYKGSKESPNYRLAKALSDAYGLAVKGAISKYCNPMSRDDLWQMNWAEMPAVIVECGFSSNPSDSAWLENENNFSIVAQGIANGIDDYFEGEKNRK